ncbi:MAG: STAS domain-containing protein [Planctomycetota bacterium]|nr:STAS domain-containing protein [Planctomycetota bacterium]MDA0920469.1 STAS domain-containing protein [Planctomycetota bacterium]
MELHCLSSEDNTAMLAICGQINQTFVHPERTTEFEELVGPEVWRRTTLIDLSDATFVDSCGIGWLISIHRRFQREGGRLVLHSLSPVVHRILSMIKLDNVVSIVHSEDDARRIAQEVQHD